MKPPVHLLSLQLGSKGYPGDSHPQRAHPARRSFLSNTEIEGGRVENEPRSDEASAGQDICKLGQDRLLGSSPKANNSKDTLHTHGTQTQLGKGQLTTGPTSLPPRAGKAPDINRARAVTGTLTQHGLSPE
ncbi:hypothetical protein P7K49_031322, partial [Saguinus oedipus]